MRCLNRERHIMGYLMLCRMQLSEQVLPSGIMTCSSLTKYSFKKYS
jgi:hypothetical protein